MSPIYEYRCQSCGHQLERLQTFDEPFDNRCPHCGKNTLEKQVSLSSFQLKGKGWYKTDFSKEATLKKETSVENTSEKKAVPQVKEKVQSKVTDAESTK